MNRREQHYTIVDEHSPTCEGCGEQIAYNSQAAGRPASDNPDRLLNGWYHHDGMKRDHEATPPFGTSGEDELARTRARMDQARMQVRDHLDKQMNEMSLGNAVDRIFE